jgi:hypothetical protein
MNQKSLLGIALLVIGIVLLIVGFNASQSPVEEITESFTGQFSDETMFYLIGGAIAGVIGIVMLLKK